MSGSKSIFLPTALTVFVSAVIFGGVGYYLAKDKYASEATSTFN